MSNIIGNRLIYIRESLNLTQEKFSDILQVNFRTYQNWENGNRIPNTNALVHIADTLHISTDWLLGRDQYFIIHNKSDISIIKDILNI
ncbi:helix-turn-helix domain-containing protein [Abyssisolibacter fermentans]|uniref:helix-turn-helix domain-containing protein n=1 Tax=Abyssisolibacter fermentans TaxID=1766203 RepID=UPI000833CD13|nr:helix-turn-helix transcriptional regulator [Abyssisolibacter fermentans]